MQWTRTMMRFWSMCQGISCELKLVRVWTSLNGGYILSGVILVLMLWQAEGCLELWSILLWLHLCLCLKASISFSRILWKSMSYLVGIKSGLYRRIKMAIKQVCTKCTLPGETFWSECRSKVLRKNFVSSIGTEYISCIYLLMKWTKLYLLKVNE